MTQITPQCPKGYILNKKKCSCSKDETNDLKEILLKNFLKTTKKGTTQTSKLHRCPNGFNRNKKNKKCEPHYNRKTIKRNIRNENYKKKTKVPKKSTTRKATTTTRKAASTTRKAQPTTRKAQPTTRKATTTTRKATPTTRKAQPTTRKSVRFDKSPIVIKDSTSLELKEISKAIERITRNMPNILADKSELTKKIKKTLVSKNSYSPSINKELVTLQRAENKNIFGCGIEKKINFNNSNYKIVLPKVKIGKDEAGKPICGTRKDSKVIERMLFNLSIQKVDTNKFIAPMQKHSNCWFNTMFVCFFLSDKGRKFFRFFRQLMITGKHVDGKPIKSERIAEALFLLNMCIEASFNREEISDNANMALTMDTNFIISTIYKNLPLTIRKENDMPDVGKAYNPLEFYIGIMKYLNNQSLNLQEIGVSTLNRIRNKTVSKVPHIYVTSVHFSESKQNNNIPKTFVVKRDGKKYNFKLDSVVIMDTQKTHFCALLTCNGVQKGFDGASFKRINDFKWLQLLNTDKNWTFEGSSTNWNFKNSYQLLFYYRTNID